MKDLVKFDGGAELGDEKSLKALEKIAEQSEPGQVLESVDQVQLPRVKMGAGGVVCFVMPDETMPKEFAAIILHAWNANAWWEKPMEESGNAAPDCCSLDGRFPDPGRSGNQQADKCRGCIQNAFREDGSGKPCKNMKRLLLFVSGKAVPYVFSAPPTSLKRVNEYLLSLVDMKVPDYSLVVTKFGVEAAASKEGIKYGKLTLTADKLIADPQNLEAALAEIKERAEPYKKIAMEMGVDLEEDYPMTETASPSEHPPFEAAPEEKETDGDKNIPF